MHIVLQKSCTSEKLNKQQLFSAVLYFRKVVQEIFSELNETKAKVPIFPGAKTESREETEGGHRVATPTLGAAWPWPVPRHGVGPPGTPPT